MEWLYYLLEANLYLLLFYGFYRLLLAKTTFYNGNRYFLLASLVLAFLIPLVQLSYLKPTISGYQNSASTATENFNATIGIELVVQVGYIIVCSIFIIKLILSLLKITHLWRNGRKHNADNYTIVELNEKLAAFSFFNILFIHPNLMHNGTVIRHEMTHIKEKHSYDLLLLETIQIVSWFNPIIYLIRKDLKLLHEFIADQATTQEQINKHEYAMFLIESSLINFSIPFTNQFFNSQILKQRINMLNKEKTAKWVKLHFALAIPLLLGMLCLSTLAFSKDYGYFDLLPNGKSVQDTLKKMRKPLPPPPPKKKDQVKFSPPVIKTDGNKLQNPPPAEPPPPSNKAKKDQVKFPPPVIKPDGKKTSLKLIEGDPTKQPEIMLEVVIEADPTKSQDKLNDEIKDVLIKKKANN